MVEAIFVGEETSCQGRYFAWLFATLIDQLHDIAAGAEGLWAVAAQHHAGDARIFCPGLQAFVECFDHRQGEGVEALLRVQAGDADAIAVQAGAFFELQVHRGFLRRVDDGLSIHLTGL